MKTVFSFFLTFFLTSMFFLGYAQKKIQVLNNIESRIDAAFIQCFQAGPSELEQIIQDLNVAQQANDDRNIAYWEAYAYYYLAIYHINKQGQEEGQKANEQGIKILKSIAEKNSEDHTLLASMYSLGISFDPQNSVILSGKASTHVNKALKLDDKNLRAYVARGRSDYYTPIEYGGGEVVEENMLKALSLETSYSDNPYAPTWGRDDAFNVLVGYYIREDKLDQAMIYCRKGLKEFPEDYGLTQKLKKMNP